MQSPFVSSHAVTRYQQRVRPAATRLEAVADIRWIAAHAHARSRPRWWTRVAGQEPGCRYLYSASRPDVCLVVKGGTVVTVFSRSACARWRQARNGVYFGDLPGVAGDHGAGSTVVGEAA